MPIQALSLPVFAYEPLPLTTFPVPGVWVNDIIGNPGRGVLGD